MLKACAIRPIEHVTEKCALPGFVPVFGMSEKCRAFEGFWISPRVWATVLAFRVQDAGGPMIPRLGMVGRYGVFTVALVAVCTLGTAWLLQLRDKRGATEQWQWQAEIVGRAVAEAGLEEGFDAHENEAAMRKLFNELRARGVAYLAVRDARLNLLVAHSVLAGPIPPLDRLPAGKRGVVRTIDVAPAGPRMVEVAATVFAPMSADSAGGVSQAHGKRVPAGVVQLGLTPEALRATSRFSVGDIWAVPFLATVLSGILVVVGTRRPMRRLDALVAGVSRRCRGSREGRFDESGGDEIAELSRALNTLVDHLIETENSVRDARWTLEEKVHARTRRLERAVEQALEQAQVSEESARASSMLLMSVAHEIRSRTNRLLGIADRLVASDLTPGQTRQVEEIRDASRRLLRVAGDCLVMGGGRGVRVGAVSESFDIVSETEDIVASYVETARGKGIELVVALDPAIPDLVRGDATRWRHVVGNLVRNAVQYTDRGQVVLRAVSDLEGVDRVKIRLDVEDTGVGIAAEALGSVFEAFNRGDRSLKGENEGRGLGLAIVKQFVAMMGGRTGVTSRPGAGSCFWVEVVFGREGRRAGDGATGQEPLNGTVLVLVDNDDIRTNLVRHLEAWGLRVVAAGQAADAMAGSGPDPGSTAYVAAVVDGSVRDPDGGAAWRSLVERAPTLNGRIVVLGHVAEAGDVQQPGGAFAHLAKPVRMRRLRETLERLVSTVAEFEMTRGSARVDVAANQGDGDDHDASPPGSGRILVVEDDRANLELTLQALERLGYEVDVARDGRQAVETFLRNRYDLVLMACKLPGMDGFEATRVMRRWETVEGGLRCTTPIVALTGGVHEEELRACSRAGMTDVLNKPFSEDEFESMVKRWIVPGPGVNNAGHDASEVALFPPPGSQRGPTPKDQGLAPGDEGGRDESPVIREKALEKIRALQQPGKPDIVATVVNYYLEDAPVMMSALEQALAASNPDDVRGVAHRLKTGSASVGAVRLATLCRELEALGRCGETTPMGEVVAQIREEYVRVETVLAGCLAGHGGEH